MQEGHFFSKKCNFEKFSSQNNLAMKVDDKLRKKLVNRP